MNDRALKEPTGTDIAMVMEHVAGTRETYTLDEAGARKALSDLESAHHLMRLAAAEIRKLYTPDMFWPLDDGESFYATIDQLNADQRDADTDVIAVSTAKGLPEIFIATQVLAVDEQAAPSETKTWIFTTRTDAARCYPESLAAAIAAQKAREGQA